MGQSEDGHYIIFLKADGTLSGLRVVDCLYNSKITVVNNINDLTNIVSVVQSTTSNGCSGAYQILAIENNGKQHALELD